MFATQPPGRLGFRDASPWRYSMIRKSGNRFSEKIMLKQGDETMNRSI
jgi:hypothetical protein